MDLNGFATHKSSHPCYVAFLGFWRCVQIRDAHKTWQTDLHELHSLNVKLPALFLRVAWKRRFEARARSVGNPVRDLGPILKIAFKSGSSSLHPFRPLLPNVSLFYFIDFSRLRCSETVKASQYTERRVGSETRPLLANIAGLSMPLGGAPLTHFSVKTEQTNMTWSLEPNSF